MKNLLLFMLLPYFLSAQDTAAINRAQTNYYKRENERLTTQLNEQQSISNQWQQSTTTLHSQNKKAKKSRNTWIVILSFVAVGSIITAIVK